MAAPLSTGALPPPSAPSFPQPAGAERRAGLSREGPPCRLLLPKSHGHRERRQGQPPPHRNFGVPGQDPGSSHRPAPVAPPPHLRDPPAGQGRGGLRSLPPARRAQRRPPRLPGSLLPLLPPFPALGGGDRQHSCLPFLAFPFAESGGAGVWPRGWGRGRGLDPLPAGQRGRGLPWNSRRRVPPEPPSPRRRAAVPPRPTPPAPAQRRPERRGSPRNSAGAFSNNKGLEAGRRVGSDGRRFQRDPGSCSRRPAGTAAARPGAERTGARDGLGPDGESK
ncbi:extensin-like [Corvus kubaryi]|uniref:extensin-like n=1 Tax=Corvus kubaryi TaxID=68294 RepID=UPI001C058522|nr:extensin-like [Corvus kubaryi]